MTAAANARPTSEWKLVIHGGAGRIEKSTTTPEKERAVRAGLDAALAKGSAILDAGGTALDAVEAAVRVLEDDSNFNAGRGSVFTFDGRHELDASIMDGRDRSAGAVAAVTRTKNPISLARSVMEKSGHVFLTGEGADQFSREQGLEQVDPAYFATPDRRRQLEEFKAQKVSALDVEYKYGTVGAVAVDVHGHVATATSTGGTTGKLWGRIGDSPLIGAGSYADDRSAAVSATGAGEYFIRTVASYSVSERVRAGQPLAQALKAVLADIKALGGDGGMIAVTAAGDVAWDFNTAGMYRGSADKAGRTIAIYGDSDER